MPDADLIGDEGLSALVDRLVECHRSMVQRSMPEIRAHILAAPIGAAAGEHRDLLAAFDIFCDRLQQHIDQEDKIVLQLIKSLDGAERLDVFHCKSIGRPIGVMICEHRSIAEAMECLRRAAAAYAARACDLPSPDCPAAQAASAVMEAVAKLESNLTDCSTAEETIVFPRAIAREAHLAGQ